MVYFIIGTTYSNRSIRLESRNRQRTMKAFAKLQRLKDKIRFVSVTAARDELALRRGFGEDIAEFTGTLHKVPTSAEADMSLYNGPFCR